MTNELNKSRPIGAVHASDCSLWTTEPKVCDCGGIEWPNTPPHDTPYRVGPAAPHVANHCSHTIYSGPDDGHGGGLYEAHIPGNGPASLKHAKFIARACNSHYELLAALEAAEAWMTSQYKGQHMAPDHPIRLAATAIAKAREQA